MSINFQKCLFAETITSGPVLNRLVTMLHPFYN